MRALTGLRRMKKYIFYHENYTLGGDSVYLKTILNNINDGDYLLVCTGSNCVKKYFLNLRINASSLRIFNSYSYSSFVYAVCYQKFIVKLLARVLIKLASPILKLVLMIRLKSFIKKLDIKNYDGVVINSGGFYGTECSRLFMKYVNIPCTYILHNHIPDSATRNKRSFLSVGRYVKKWIVGSSFIEEQLTDECKVDKQRIHYVAYGVKPSLEPKNIDSIRVRDKLGISSDAYVIIHPSVFDERKGHYYTLHAFKQFRQKVDTAKLVLAGTGGTYIKTAKRLIKELSIEKDVVFAGFYSPIEELILSSDLLCLPSQSYDTTPLVILLALACKIPVLTTKRRDFEEVLVDGKNALLVSTGEYNSIIDKMLKLYNNKELRDEIVSNGFQVYNNYYSEDKMVRNTISVLNNIC